MIPTEGAIYKHLIKNPPKSRGTTLGSAYWNGYNGLPNRYLKTSMTYEAWLAGKHTRRREK